MSLTGPPPLSFNPARRLVSDLLDERRATVPFPPGETSFSMRRTRAFADNPLPVLLDGYERFGPVFTLRLFHGNGVWMIGPEANHHMLVSHASNFSWRDGHMGDLAPLLGDGLLTIDGDFHRRSRRIMLPAFHHEVIAAAAQTMNTEIDDALADWHDGARIDIYYWTRRLALRIAMRALFGFDPDAHGRIDVARAFEVGLGFWSRDYVLQVLRGPRSPYAQMQSARRALDHVIFAEIDRRRRAGERGEDVLSLLIGATDEDGDRLSDQQIRDQVMTLLFAGHDTTTSTIGFMFYELARHPEIAAALHDELIGADPADAVTLMNGSHRLLEMVLDETLRMYPPAWVGARKAIEPYEFAGRTVPGGAYVHYSSWVSHHLAHVFREPSQFRPERFAPEAKSALPKGAYVPFGAGSRICIGMRFGQLEVKAIAIALLRRFEFELEPGYELRIRQMPTISPKDGVPLTVRTRRQTAALAA